MNNLVRDKLREIVTTYGRSVCDDRLRCRGLLNDLCGQHRREIFVLLSALEDGVVAELLNSKTGVPLELLLARLTKRLQDNLALAEDACRWAVESWAVALGVLAAPPDPLPVAVPVYQPPTLGGAGTKPASPAPIHLPQKPRVAFSWWRVLVKIGRELLASVDRSWPPPSKTKRGLAVKLVVVGVIGVVCFGLLFGVPWYLSEVNPITAEGQFSLGLKYANGNGRARDDVQAVAWYRKAAEQGHVGAQDNLGVMYEQGHGVAQDYVQAAAWYRKSADQGNAAAQYNLGQIYEQGLGVPKDDVQMVAWYRKAADQGNAMAQNNLGRMYGRGRGVAQDYVQAVAWYRKAADQGNAAAQFGLGRMYEKGQGVAQDDVQAVVWYRRAADQGEFAATHALDILKQQNRLKNK